MQIARSAIITTVSVRIAVMVITILIYFIDPDVLKCSPCSFCFNMIRTVVNILLIFLKKKACDESHHCKIFTPTLKGRTTFTM